MYFAAVLWAWKVEDRRDLLGVSLDSSLSDNVAEEFSRSDTEGTLGRVELHPVVIQDLEAVA